MKTTMFLLASLVAAVSVAAGAPSYSWTAWTYDTSKDPMTDATVKTATILSTNLVDFKFPYNGPQRAMLLLRRVLDKEGNYDIQDERTLFAIERGQFVCRVDGCRIRIRFDDVAPESWDASQPADGSTNVLFLGRAWDFPPRVIKATTIQIAATVYQEGTPVFTFNVAGLKW